MARRGENIYKRKDGRYEGRYIKYYDVSGKAIYGYVYAKSYSQAKERLAVCKTEKRVTVSGGNTKLCDWCDIWLKSQGGQKFTTVRIYEGHIENHIKPKLGQIPLKKLNNDILQNFVNTFSFSSAMIRTVFTTLKSVLRAAEEKEYITCIYNKVKLPKKEKSFIRVLTPEEQKKLENVLTEHENIGILICLYTGLRIGEVCALKWRDINFEKSVLTVKGTQARGENGVEIIPPKSKSSKREIPIPPFLLQKLRDVPYNCEFVISKHGKPFDVRTYNRHFKALLRKAELPDIKYHSLRHTFATRALEVGMDYRTLSEVLGHSSVAITLDLYAHSLDEHKKNQMNKMEEIYSANRP